jgi:hypothetical protein
MARDLHKLEKKHLEVLATYAELVRDAVAHLGSLIDMEATPELPVAAEEPGLPGDRCACGHPLSDHILHNGERKECQNRGCPCGSFHCFGRDRRPQDPHDPLSRRTVTRGTLLGILDRLDDALERNEQLAAAAASRDLRHLVDDLPL